MQQLRSQKRSKAVVPRPASRLTPTRIVGIGASAGGLDALTRLFGALPPDTGLCMVVVQHLDPSHRSALAGLVARTTQMGVEEVVDGGEPLANRVYIMPPNTALTLRAGRLRLRPRTPGKGPHMPVDEFFRSLAKQQGKGAIGIVLSGTASDGAQGLAAIKAAGGTTLAQLPATAAYPGMPEAAIAAHAVDSVLPPEEIGRHLATVAQPRKTARKAPAAARRPEPGEDAYTAILDLLRSETGVDFRSYKANSIRRRIERRMGLAGRQDLGSYLALLQSNGTEVQALLEGMLVSVTGFFRDPKAFQALQEKAFPAIVAAHKENEPVRIWVPGCSTGEEAYSIAIAYLEFTQTLKKPAPPLQLFATDLSEAAIAKARLGCYPTKELAKVPRDKRRYFVEAADGTGHCITKQVRQMCVFSRHDVTRDPPFAKLDLVSCRNLLIYFGSDLQDRVVPAFHYALNRGGFLLLGSSESLPRFAGSFEAIDSANRLFRRADAAIRGLPVRTQPPTRPAPPRTRAGIAPELPSLPMDAKRVLEHAILANATPSAVLVDAHLEVLMMHGKMDPYLQVKEGTPGHNLLKMAREGLGAEIGRAVAKVRKLRKPVEVKDVPFKGKGKGRDLLLQVLPVAEQVAGVPCYLVLFRPMPHPAAAGKTGRVRPVAFERSQEVRRMRRELASTQQLMQLNIDRLEAVNDELRAASEELQSSNEELQSTNEELQTAQEELQSTNEELTTLNDELASTNAELVSLSDDLENVFSSAKVAILLLDKDQRIRRMTATVREILNLLPIDVGRPLTDIALHLAGPSLAETIAKVLQDNQPAVLETQDRTGRWYEVVLRPYWQQGKTANGVVLTFTDIDERKRSLGRAQGMEAELEEKARQLAASNAQLEEFASVASHDLREPLRMVASYLQLLEEHLEGHLDQEAAGHLQRAIAGASRMQRLIHDLLAYAKLGTDKPPKVRVALDSLLGDVEQNLRVSLKKSGARLTRDKLPVVVGVPTQLAELFQNLLANGLKFHGEAPPVLHVGVRQVGNEYEFSVRDNGIGIAAMDLPRLFRLFQRLHTRSEYPGNGLGLAICKRIVENHHGRIWVESEPGRGTSFWFTLPVPEASA